MKSRLVLIVGVIALFALHATSAAAAPEAPAQKQATASVVRGTSAPIASWPWLAFVVNEEPGEEFSCSGTVVAPRVILTAGHCVEDTEGSGRLIPPRGYAVVTGVSNLRSAAESNVSLVAQTLVFPQYEPAENRGDAGLLILEEPVAAPAIELAGESDGRLIEGGSVVKVAGWGLTEGQNRSAPAALREGTLVSRSPSSCDTAVSKFSPTYLPEWQFCAEDVSRHEVSACNGDSGGPAVAQSPEGIAIEVGITSFGALGCDPRRPGVFTRVDKVSAWVDSWIAAVEYGAPAPAIVIPEVHIPTLSIPEAKELIAIGLGEDFRYRFQQAKAVLINRCARVEPEKAKCSVAWLQGGNFYYGTATAYLTLQEGAAVWDYRYKIHWVDDYCFFRSDHPQTCVFRVRKR